MYYYGARYYDPRLSIFISVEPLAEIYRDIGGYAYVANNPINFIDPDGRYIRVWYKTGRNSNGQAVGRYWDFNGENASAAPDNQFVKDFLAAYNYNVSNGGGDPNTKRQKIQNAVDVTDQILKSNEAISAIEEYIANAVRRNSHKGILKIGKISGSLSKVTGIAVTGLEYLNGEISGLELTFDLGTAATSIWVCSEVAAALGGPYGFAGGAAVGVVAEYVIKPLYVNIVKPHIVVPAQKSYNSWWTGYYNQIIFNISNYY